MAYTKHNNTMLRYVCLFVFIIIVAFITVSNIIASPNEHTSGVVLLTDDKLLGMLSKDIGLAKSEINCAMYMFKTDGIDKDTTQLLRGAMLDAQNRGVKVSLIFELGDKDDITTKYNKFTGDILAQGGVKVVYDAPDRRLHTKMCVIDNNITYVGSHNYTYSALRRNSEVTVRITSAEVATEANEYINELIYHAETSAQKRK